MKKPEPLQKTPKIDKDKSREQKRERRDATSAGTFRDGYFSDMKGVNLGSSTATAKEEGKEKGPLEEKRILGQSQKGLNRNKNSDVKNRIHDEVMEGMDSIKPKLPGSPSDPNPVKARMNNQGNSLLQSEVSIGKSYNDMKKSRKPLGIAMAADTDYTVAPDKDKHLGYDKKGRPVGVKGVPDKPMKVSSKGQRMISDNSHEEGNPFDFDNASKIHGKQANHQASRQMSVTKSIASYNDMKKSETAVEDLAKTGTATKLALAAALAGPILVQQNGSNTKGTLFNDHEEAPVTRTIAGEPAHERDSNPEEERTDLGNGITHISKPASYSVKYVDKKAESVKSKLKTIREQIKGDEDGIM